MLIVFVVLPVFCVSAGTVSLSYKLAMFGYSEKEIGDIVSGKKTQKQVDRKYKRKMLGFLDGGQNNVGFWPDRSLKVFKKIDRSPKAVHERRPDPESPLSAYEKKKLLLAVKPYWEIVKDAADQHNVKKTLILAIIQAESGFDPRAVSKKGAVGLMQLMPHTAYGLGATNLFDLRQNIFAGTQYLADCLKAFDTVDLAIAAYNTGPSRVAAHNNIPPFKETRNFVKNVLDYEKVYRHLIGAL